MRALEMEPTKAYRSISRVFPFTSLKAKQIGQKDGRVARAQVKTKKR